MQDKDFLKRMQACLRMAHDEVGSRHQRVRLDGHVTSLPHDIDMVNCYCRIAKDWRRLETMISEGKQ